jgi:hypothetical protein
MNLMAKIRHRAKGHLFHGDDMAQAYRRQPDGTMKKSGYVVHIRCVRTGCDFTETRHIAAVPRPRAETVVSLLDEHKE